MRVICIKDNWHQVKEPSPKIDDIDDVTGVHEKNEEPFIKGKWYRLERFSRKEFYSGNFREIADEKDLIEYRNKITIPELMAFEPVGNVHVICFVKQPIVY